MYFTEGRLRKYERMMQEKPRHERDPVKTMQDQDCKHCLYYDKEHDKCSKERCAVFNE